jgi:hypothetical protein
MNEITYNVPATLFDSYSSRGAGLIVRAETAPSLVECLSDKRLDSIFCVQFAVKDFDPAAYLAWPCLAPVDVVLLDAASEFPVLYRVSDLVASRPVRVSVRVGRGFSKAVRLAVALRLPVKLEVAQPDAPLVDELLDVLDLYLHDSLTRRPIEYFHSVLMGLYHENPATIWEIQEDDPSRVRHISEQGQETLSPRFAGLPLTGSAEGFVEAYRQTVCAENAECTACEFLPVCSGYFKWPDPSFSCDGVKTLFRTLHDAAMSLREDLAACQSDGSTETP